MYLIPLLLILVVGVGILAGPLFAVIVLAAFLVGLGVYKFFGPGTDAEHKPTAETTVVGKPQTSRREDVEGGVWGEKRPG